MDGILSVIASEAKQSHLSARDCFGVLRTPRNDGKLTRR
jgi:hypothetical protein